MNLNGSQLMGGSWLGADYVQRYAKKEDAKGEEGGNDSMSEDASNGFLSSSDEEDMQPAGVADIS